VLNQPGGRGDCDLRESDLVLRPIAAHMGARAEPLEDYGSALGWAEMRGAARDAHRYTPELELFDVGGRRLDEVRYHPADHRFMDLSVSAGYAAIAWEGGDGGHVTHAAMVYLASQVEPGHCCPLTMTYAAAPVIAAAEGIPSGWHAKITSRQYDPPSRRYRASAVRPSAWR
jgi:putative acyl-CoA dehydrogenase